MKIQIQSSNEIFVNIKKLFLMSENNMLNKQEEMLESISELTV